ncbi:MAG: MFS transporter [Chromatiales bacterium]|jgi:PPP family 3-phenylpropionic acid transporter
MPYWRLSSFYLFYFAALGALIPFWTLYLSSLGFSSIQIGQLMAIPTATKIIAPYLWGWLGDHIGRRMAIVRTGSLLAFLTFLLVFWLSDYAGLALAMSLFSFFWNAVLPQVEVVTFHYLKDETPKYSRIRVWGSVGFVVAVTGLGFIVDSLGPSSILPVLALLYLGIWLASLLIPEDEEGRATDEPHIHIGSFMRQPAILAFFAACLLMQMSHGTYYTFYSIYLESQGYSKSLIGELWALGVVAEVIVYIFFMHAALVRFGAIRLLMFSLLLAALRWLLIGSFSEHLSILLLAQLLHAATFGIFHAAAIHSVHHRFPRRLLGRGQALYSSVSFGLGGTLGSLSSGYLWEYFGPFTSFLISTLISLAAFLIIFLAHRSGQFAAQTP